MEKPYTGLTALVKVSDEKVAYLNSVTLTLEKDVIEILQFGAQYREKIPAIKNWTASAEGTAAFSSGESQHKLYQAYESGEFIELEVALDEGTHFKGSALVKSLEISGAPDDAMNISIEFEGSNAVTLTVPERRNIMISSGVGGTTNPAGAVRVVKGKDLEIQVLPGAGKTPDKYYINEDKTGQDIQESKIKLSSVTEDTTVRVEFKDV